jgi:pyrimidine-specific ribonucleoside hydrolase
MPETEERSRRLGADPAAGIPVALGDGRLVHAGHAPAEGGGVPAHQLIHKQALLYGGELELLALGPLSNLAKAILARPELARGIKRIYLAGGAYAGGDVSPAAERSIHADAEAAKIVFESGIPIVMLGLDVEEAARLSPSEASALLPDASDAQSRGFVPALGLATLISALDESVATFRECHVDIETRGELTYGKTVCDVDNPSRGKPNAKVALGLDHDRFLASARRLFARTE